MQGAGSRIWWSPALLTLALVALHALPGSDLQPTTWLTTWHLDKLLHAMAFALWGLSITVAWAKQRRFDSLSGHVLGVVGLSLTFGTVLEAMQGALMPSRVADAGDLLADVLGGCLSQGMFFVIFRAWPGRIAND